MPAPFPQYQFGLLFLQVFLFFFFPTTTCFETARFYSQVISETRAFLLPEVLLGPDLFPITLSWMHPFRIPPFVMLGWPWPDSKGAVHITKLVWKADIKKARAPDDSGINVRHQNKLLSDIMGSLQIQKKELLILHSLFTGDREPRRTVWNAATSVACLRCWGMTWSQEQLCHPCRHGGIHARAFRSNSRDLASQFHGLSLHYYSVLMESIKKIIERAMSGGGPWVGPVMSSLHRSEPESYPLAFSCHDKSHLQNHYLC